ncbi:MAG TPA: hypothetical protein VE592_13940 [Geminicoccaceae bacterium]|nr:hypothetical protein [Geminicoccaceae bacterium]
MIVLGALPSCTTATPQQDAASLFAVHKVIVLDGDGQENARSKLIVADVTGDGRPDWILKNGFRLIKAYDHDGAKLFEHRNPDGFANGAPWHPFVDLAWDLDGDGKAEIIATWHKADGHYLQILDGETGAVLRQKKLWHDRAPRGNNAILMALMFPDASARPVILVEDGLATGAQSRGYDHIRAFDRELDTLWIASTPDAGHYMFPYDLDQDAATDVLFAGKHVLDAQGRLRWTMSGWGADHVDSLAAGDIDPTRPGYEVVAVGRTGTRMYDVEDGSILWHLDTSAIPDPQHVMIGELSPAAAGLEIVVKERASEPGRETYLIDYRGRIHDRVSHGPAPYLNADLDGDRRVDEMIAGRGVATDLSLTETSNDAWYVGAQGLSGNERGLHPHEIWNPHPIVQDVLGDAREEMIVWGRHALVVGTPVRGAGGASLRGHRAYQLRGVNQAFNRAGLYFDFRTTELDEAQIASATAGRAPVRLEVR